MELSWSIQVWFRSRPYRRIWFCLPALLAITSSLLFAFWVTGWTFVGTRTDYARLARRALAKRDFQTARVACERLLASGNELRADNLFCLALAMQGLGQEQAAGTLLREAAPLDKPGSLEAHLMMARSILAGTNSSALSLSAAQAQLKQALVLDPGSPEANELLGRIYMQKREWDSAKTQLMKIVATHPRALLLLALVSRELGDEVGARGWAERAVKAYRDRVEKAAVDHPADRIAWAQGLMFQEKYPETIKVLEDGRKKSGRGLYEVSLGEAYATWSQALAVTEPRNLAQRIRLIQQGLEFAPQNTKLLQALVQLSHFEGDEARQARAVITRMMGEGGSAAILHFVVGSDAWERGEMEAAGKHFGLAFEMAPNLPAVANNMAAFLAMGEKPDLPRARAIIQALVEKYPTDPFFRDTRGQILVRQNQWEEAVKDLEYALPLLPTTRATHAALARAYRGLRMDELAAEHERLATAGEAQPRTGKSPQPAKR